MSTYTLRYDLELLVSFFFLSLPWNQDSIFGYVGEIFAVILTFNVLTISAGQLFMIFISICIHFFTFNEMFASFVDELGNATKEKKTTASIQKLIEFHTNIKGYVCVMCVVYEIFCKFYEPIHFFRFFLNSRDAFSFYFGIIFIFNILGVASLLFLIELV